MSVEDKYLKEADHTHKGDDYQYAVETYIDGNISDFKEWLNKKASKRDIILALDYYMDVTSSTCYKFMDILLRYLK